MRLLFLVSLFSLPTVVVAEPPQPQSGTDARAWQELARAWTRGRKQPRDFSCVVEGIEQDPLYKTERKYTVEIQGAAPNMLRALYRDTNGKPFYLFVYAEGKLHWFNYATQTEMVLNPTPKRRHWWDAEWMIFSGFDDHTLFPFFRLSPEEIQTRFDVEEIRQDRREVSFILRPRLKDDRSSYQKIQFLLEKADWTVSRIVYVSPNGGLATWNIRQYQTNLSPAITLKTVMHDVPVGWPKPGATR
jgi:hypothetical protein